MEKLVINNCYGRYALSDKAVRWLRENGVEDALGGSFYMDRHNPILVRCVETLGAEASAPHAQLKVVEIEGNRYVIQEHDGLEEAVEPKDIGWVVIERRKNAAE